MNTDFPDLNIPTTGYGGMGYTPVPQTYVPEAMPAWMQGGQMDLGGQGFQGMGGLGKGAPNWFQMPQWGTDAVTGQPLTQEAMQPPSYEQPQTQQTAPDSGQQFAPTPSNPARDMWMSGFRGGRDNVHMYANSLDPYARAQWEAGQAARNEERYGGSKNWGYD